MLDRGGGDRLGAENAKTRVDCFDKLNILSIVNRIKVITAIWLIGVSSSPLFGYLGSFEQNDGYHTPNIVTGYQNENDTGVIPSAGIAGDVSFYRQNLPSNGFISWVPNSAYPTTSNDPSHGPDVTRYNAGQFGVTSGGPGGVGVDIADDSGLWRAVAGGRLVEDAGAPFYSGSTTLERDHIIGWRYTGARTGSNVLDVLAGEGDLMYDYSFDSRDLAGYAPNATGSHEVSMSFWFCPTDFDDTYGDNVFGLAVRDNLGQSLIEFGYTGDNRVQYRVGNSSLWQTTSHVAGASGWSNAIVEVNTLTNVTSFSLRAWNDGGSFLGTRTAILSDVAIGVEAGSLDTLRWSAKGGVFDNDTLDRAEKNTFDDFEFTVTPVPEPGSALLMAMGGLLALRRKRR